MLALKSGKKYNYDFLTIESDVIEEVNDIVIRNEDNKSSHSNNITNGFIFPTQDSYCDVYFVVKNIIYYDDFSTDVFMSTSKTIYVKNQITQLLDVEYLRMNLCKPGDRIKINNLSKLNIDFTVISSNNTRYVFTGFDRFVVTDNGSAVDILTIFEENCSVLINEDCAEYIKNYNKILNGVRNLSKSYNAFNKIEKNIENFIAVNMAVNSKQSESIYRNIKYIGKICLKSARLYSSKDIKFS